MEPDDPHTSHRSTPQELQQLIAHQRAAVPFLTWREPGGPLQFVTLDAGRTGATIGRAPKADVRLKDDGAVSSVHAELRPLAEQWVVSDDGLSRNGTYVDGAKVGMHHRLRDQDRIRVGNTLLVFHAPQPAGAIGQELAPTFTIDASDAVDRSDLSRIELDVLRLLCAPILADRNAEPAPTQQIAGEVMLTTYGVKRILTRLFKKFNIPRDARNKRSMLVRKAIDSAVISRRDMR
jgi:pSer/pThr/pTyr-binding forkhead associated (FHA) protein